MEQPQMSDWDLMMPGMGLTAIGLAGVILSYLGIANTFLTGMQALSGLTMFVGILIIILVPTIVLAFFSMKSPKHFKPIATIFVAAMIVGIGSYTAFGFIGPGAQFHLQSVNQTAARSTAPVSNVPVIS